MVMCTSRVVFLISEIIIFYGDKLGFFLLSNLSIKRKSIEFSKSTNGKTLSQLF